MSRDPGLAARARAWLAAADREVTVPRLAATVMLVRDGDGGPEVYVQRRVASMAFAPSTVVFPGGGVDPADHALDVATPGLAELAGAMGVGVAAAAPLAAAAVREVEEECGVRAHGRGPARSSTLGDARVRAAAVRHLDPRRRHARGQQATGTTTESDHSAWVLPRELLARHATGEVRMLPPTVISLEQLAGFTDAASFLADRPRVARVVPELVLGADGIPMLRTVLP